MNYKMLLLSVLVILPNLMQAVLPNGYSQETPQYFDQTMRMPNNCPVTHLYATKFIIPVQVKIIHDPTPNFEVGSAATNSTATANNSVVTFNGDDKYSFSVRTNSTGQFSFLAKASYNDGAEHQIWVQYWSENQQVTVDQYSTLNGQFCRNFLVDTASPPPVIDIQKTIQSAEATTFAAIVGVLSQDHDSLGQLQVIVIVTLGSLIIVQIINMIFHKNEKRVIEVFQRKIKILENKYEEGGRMLMVQSKHLAMTDKRNEEKLDRFMQILLINFDQFKSDMKDIMKNGNKMIASKEDECIIIPKPANKEDVVGDAPEIPIEEIIPKTEPVLEEIKEKKSGIGKILSSIHDSLSKKKVLPRKEKKVTSEEEWYKILKEEKKLTEKQATDAYVKLEKYVSNHREDENAYNKLMAYYRIATGDRDDTTS